MDFDEDAGAAALAAKAKEMTATRRKGIDR